MSFSLLPFFSAVSATSGSIVICFLTFLSFLEETGLGIQWREGTRWQLCCRDYQNPSLLAFPPQVTPARDQTSLHRGERRLLTVIRSCSSFFILFLKSCGLLVKSVIADKNVPTNSRPGLWNRMRLNLVPLWVRIWKPDVIFLSSPNLVYKRTPIILTWAFGNRSLFSVLF